MRHILFFFSVAVLSFLRCSSSSPSLLIFAGAASKPPLEEVAAQFEKETGIPVEIVFGGSGYVLSQMELAQKGDIYFPGSSDYMELAKKKGLILKESERIVAYLVPALVVPKGNPLKIKSLKDLLRPGLRIVIANPETVCLGVYAIEIVEKNFSKREQEAFRKNLLNYTESCEKTATAISLKAADVTIGWRVFSHWDPKRLEAIPLKPEEISRVGYLPIGIVRFTKQKQLAEKFLQFLLQKGKAVFRKYRYFTTEEEAFRYIGQKKPIGGSFSVPKKWFSP